MFEHTFMVCHWPTWHRDCIWRRQQVTTTASMTSPRHVTCQCEPCVDKCHQCSHLANVFRQLVHKHTHTPLHTSQQQWDIETSVQSSSETLRHQYSLSVKHWDISTVQQWDIQTSVQSSSETLRHQYSLAVRHSDISTVQQWDIETSVQSSSDKLRHQYSLAVRQSDISTV